MIIHQLSLYFTIFIFKRFSFYFIVFKRFSLFSFKLKNWNVKKINLWIKIKICKNLEHYRVRKRIISGLNKTFSSEFKISHEIYLYFTLWFTIVEFFIFSYQILINWSILIEAYTAVIKKKKHLRIKVKKKTLPIVNCYT